MLTVAIFNSIVVLFASFAKSKNNDYWLKLSFILIFLFLAIRYDYGNDYMGYLDGYLDIEYFNFNLKNKYEPAWQILCILFKPVGFFVMIAALAAFNSIVYYRFIKKYVPPVYYWLAVFLYVFNPYFMLVHSSAMRQSVAISIFILSFDYLYRKEAIRYIITIFIASMFHQSAIMLILIYFISIYKFNITKIKIILLVFVYAFTFFLVQYISPFIDYIIREYFPRYEVYDIPYTLSTGLGFIYYIIVMLIIMYYMQYELQEKELLFKLVIISYFIIPFQFNIELISRFSMYLTPFLIVVIPLIYYKIKKRYLKILFLSSYMFITIYSFYYFFESPVWHQAFSVYKTILSAPKYIW
jgi:transmembrane protein EpsG